MASGGGGHNCWDGGERLGPPSDAAETKIAASSFRADL